MPSTILTETLLTEHQQEKFDEFIELLRAGHKRILILGSAGVGKTFFVGEAVKYLLKDRKLGSDRRNSGDIYVTAPTNKALAVLKSKVHADVTFSTIHSALKLAKWTDNKTGREVFKRVFSKKDEFAQAKYCFIDETSMLNTELEGGPDPDTKEMVDGYLSRYGMPIIYIGDDKQINPVGEPFSPVFHKNYPVVRLTEIVRQGKGNPIIDLSGDLDMIFFRIPDIRDGKGYVYDNNLGGIIDSLAEVNGTDEMKYLAWTNKVVDSINKAVRERRYGVPKKIEKGETIVFNTPYGSFYTNKEEKVIDYSIVTDYVGIPRRDTVFDQYCVPMSAVDQVKLRYYRINDSFNVIHEDSEDMFESIYKTIANNCNKYGWGHRGKNYFRDQFADIKYNHAITIHKSQGSTYKQSVLNIEDIMRNKNAEERTRLLYTGVTRASELVILNNVK